MKELEYPFDGDWILQNKRKLRRQLQDILLKNEKTAGGGNAVLRKKIAILGGSTTNDIKLALELFMLNQGILPEFYESEYNQYYQDAMFPNEELERFRPDVIYIHTTNRNVTRFPLMGDSAADIGRLLDDEYGKFSGMWDHLAKKYHCPIIQNNFEMPLYRLLGNKDASDIHGATNFLTRLNMKFYEYAQTHENFFICDINYISADFGLKRWSEQFYWHMYKYALNVSAIPLLAFNVSNIIKSIFGKNKKGFVIDMDNTLWGGVIGDDGVDNIAIGPETSMGQAYSEFQSYLKAHKQLGIVLNIASKNDHENAVSGLKHPDSVLKEDDFIFIKANWDPKDRNVADIAANLNLMPDSLVFVDDNPAERHIVSAQLPGVNAPEIGEVQDYIQVLDRSGFFEVTILSKDDLNRNAMYKENVARQALQASFANYHDYLLSLNMDADIRAFENIYMARIAQLTNKSNQYNLTTRRYTQTEIEELARQDDYITLYGKLTDRFGDNGVVSITIGHVIGDVCHIDLWLMSCRVLKRDMEFAMMDSLVGKCKERGIKTIRGYYLPTAKNGMVRDFFELQGFTKVKDDEKGNTEWVLDLTRPYINKNTVIHVNQ